MTHTNFQIFLGLGNSQEGTPISQEQFRAFWSEFSSAYLGYNSFGYDTMFEGLSEETKSMYITGLDFVALSSIVTEYQTRFGVTDILVFTLDVPWVQEKSDFLRNWALVGMERLSPATVQIHAFPSATVEPVTVNAIKSKTLQSQAGALPKRALRFNQALQTVSAWSAV